MENLLLIIIGILLLLIFALSAKVYFLHRSAKEIAEAFRDRSAADTNTLIDISTRDSYMRHLASEINVELSILRKEHLRYSCGDQELKTAVTNISHDLRTPLTAICGYLDLLEREEKSETVERYLTQIQPVIDLPEEAVWRELDAGAVNRVFSNIISNALKYSSGLGLSIAKLLTEQMGGMITAEYENDRLSIIICFPANSKE